jgi:hypothetical protein
MKPRIENFFNHFGLTFLILFTSLIWTAGCATPDPLEGFHTNYKVLDQSIVNDYQNYIQKLSPEEKKYLGPYPTDYFEDGTGQHAVTIQEGINGTVWRHVLIYDKNNKRIKTIKYASGDYHS